MNANIQLLTTKIFEEQNKYTYFLLGLSSAAIGHTINNIQFSQNFALNLPLFFAIIGWVISFFSGVCHIQKLHEYRLKNANYILENRDWFEMLKLLNPIASKAQWHSKLQQLFFLLAGGSYFFLYLVKYMIFIGYFHC